MFRSRCNGCGGSQRCSGCGGSHAAPISTLSGEGGMVHGGAANVRRRRAAARGGRASRRRGAWCGCRGRYACRIRRGCRVAAAGAALLKRLEDRREDGHPRPAVRTSGVAERAATGGCQWVVGSPTARLGGRGKEVPVLRQPQALDSASTSVSCRRAVVHNPCLWAMAGPPGLNVERSKLGGLQQGAAQQDHEGHECHLVQRQHLRAAGMEGRADGTDSPRDTHAQALAPSPINFRNTPTEAHGSQPGHHAGRPAGRHAG